MADSIHNTSLFDLIQLRSVLAVANNQCSNVSECYAAFNMTNFVNDQTTWQCASPASGQGICTSHSCSSRHDCLSHETCAGILSCDHEGHVILQNGLALYSTTCIIDDLCLYPHMYLGNRTNDTVYYPMYSVYAFLR